MPCRSASPQDYDPSDARTALHSTVLHGSSCFLVGQSARSGYVGARCDALCYNLDLTATLMNMLCEGIPEQMDGLDLWPVVQGQQPGREHVTIAWSQDVTLIDDNWWCNATFWGANPLLYDLRDDPQLTTNLAGQHPDVLERTVEMFRDDAGGEFPRWLPDAPRLPACTPIVSKPE